jgi:tRNA threonylcarbamoyladenosine biosynthesis protein TsaB
MLTLALETSALSASVAVAREDALLSEITANHQKNHSLVLMPMVEEALERAGAALADLDVISVSAGPGSFTGVRIGVTTAKSLAHALGVPVSPVSTLAALAMNVPHAVCPVCPIMDARRGQVYTALYRVTGFPETLMEPEALALEEWVMRLPAGPILFVGDGVPVCRESLRELMGERALIAPPGAWVQRASSVARLGLQLYGAGGSLSYLEALPIYLRKSQAQQAYERRTGERLDL